MLIKGFNYFPLRRGDHATFDAATRATAAYYDPQRAERMLTTLESNGFNTVRVFIIGRAPGVNPGIAGDPETQGLYQPYMENVLDFLRRARHHRIYVMPAFGDGELPANRYYQSMLNPKHREPRNSILFTKEGIAAKVRYVSDFLNEIKSEDPGLLSTFLGIEYQGELLINADQWPFTVTQGTLEMPNGKSYDMAHLEQRWNLANESLRYYHQAVFDAIKQIDPEMLVGESVYPRHNYSKDVFVPRDPVEISEKKHRRGGAQVPLDRFYPPDLVNLGGDAGDFLDIHYYRRNVKLSLVDDFHAQMRSSLFYSLAMAKIRMSKPLIMGEFGAFRKGGNTGDFYYACGDLSKVVPQMVETRDLALAMGFKGFLFWTYDTQEQNDMYNAVEQGGVLFKALTAPVK